MYFFVGKFILDDNFSDNFKHFNIVVAFAMLLLMYAN